MGFERNWCVTRVCPSCKETYYTRGHDDQGCPCSFQGFPNAPNRSCYVPYPKPAERPWCRPQPPMSREEWIARFRAYFPADD